MIKLKDIRMLASRFEIPALRVEVAALEAGVIPLRYLRNIGTLGVGGQRKLLLACVGICGLGGLGGYVVELLARMGVGSLILADGDVFGEENLNRQNLCTEQDLGGFKSEKAAERARAVNSSLQVISHRDFVRRDDAVEIFRKADLVVDALDTVSARLALEEACGILEIPMVHGAIAGECGQVMTIFPGDQGLEALYATGGEHGVEAAEGNPSTTPALVAAIQAQEVIKIICGGDLLRHGFLIIDTSSNLYQLIALK